MQLVEEYRAATGPDYISWDPSRHRPTTSDTVRKKHSRYACMIYIFTNRHSLAVESKKRAERRRNWYSNDIGIKICEMFHTITYTKST